MSLFVELFSPQVSVECPNAAFCVGVGQKPLTNRQVGSSGQFWAWEGHTGRLYHEGESNELLFIVKEGDSVTVEYDTVAKTLSFGKNDGVLSVAFHNVVKQGRDLYPVLLFTRRHNTTKVGEGEGEEGRVGREEEEDEREKGGWGGKRRKTRGRRGGWGGKRRKMRGRRGGWGGKRRKMRGRREAGEGRGGRREEEGEGRGGG